MHGEGTYKWQDGRLYHGSYQNDKKNGHGVYIWADGRSYIGNWNEGKQDDIRVYLLPNGTVRRGQWEGNTRKQWLEITEEEKEKYKATFSQAVKRAQEVETQRKVALEEVESIIKGQDQRARQHEEERLPEADEIIEQIEQQHLEEQEQAQQD